MPQASCQPLLPAPRPAGPTAACRAGSPGKQAWRRLCTDRAASGGCARPTASFACLCPPAALPLRLAGLCLHPVASVPQLPVPQLPGAAAACHPDLACTHLPSCEQMLWDLLLASGRHSDALRQIGLVHQAVQAAFGAGSIEQRMMDVRLGVSIAGAADWWAQFEGMLCFGSGSCWQAAEQGSQGSRPRAWAWSGREIAWVGVAVAAAMDGHVWRKASKAAKCCKCILLGGKASWLAVARLTPTQAAALVAFALVEPQACPSPSPTHLCRRCSLRAAGGWLECDLRCAAGAAAAV